ncbi:MAG TPA: electron transfer flavoprotein subunit beta/FixA family protein, partial [Deltaproteobacteria bacterium]|nr:electron transfer flavoprotein subunit beta/FixA family protein [Deltaproteobacteria bacterium]
MLKTVVCMKQVPMASELPWDPARKTLRRDVSDGMMNPSCKHALEAAFGLRQAHGGQVTAVTMGPPMAEEILREAVAMGADRGLLITDPALAGSDTFVTSYVLARAIEIFCQDFDLILTGCQTSDSETGQVGPQLAEELGIPCVAYADELRLEDRTLRIQRVSDSFLETLETDLPCLVTVNTANRRPRYVPLSGLQDAFGEVNILSVGTADLGIEPERVGAGGSPTRI